MKYISGSGVFYFLIYIVKKKKIIKALKLIFLIDVVFHFHAFLEFRYKRKFNKPAYNNNSHQKFNQLNS